uniref:BZIP domain-containing protein n=1 Tax=Parascaris univalens TaxID=6257 RepID=A0A915AD94_PARUN
MAPNKKPYEPYPKDTPKRRGRRRKEIAELEDKVLTIEQLEKRNRRRDNNRLAAAKLRQKKVNEMSLLKEVQVVMNSGCAIPLHLLETVQKYTKVENLNYYVNIDDASPQDVLSIVPSANILSNAVESANVNEVLPAEEIIQLQLSTECIVGEQVPPYESGEPISFVGDDLTDAVDLRGWKDSGSIGTGEVPALATLDVTYSANNQQTSKEEDDRPTFITGFTSNVETNVSPLGISSIPTPSPFAEMHAIMEWCGQLNDGPTDLTPIEKNQTPALMVSPVFTKL